MTVEIRMFTLGPIQTNAYLIGDTETRQAVLIDPVDDGATLYQQAQDAGWTIALILATHAHFDHVLGSAELVALSGAPFAIHQDEADELGNLAQRGLQLMGRVFPDAATPTRLLTDSTEHFQVGAIHLESLFTPGHSPGHLAFYLRDQGVVFGGDALFRGSVGRTDLPGGNHDVLMNSILNTLLPLGDAVVLLPGHGPQTTLGQERTTNPFILDALRAQ